MPIDIEREVCKLYETYPYPNWRNKLEPEAVHRRVELFKSLNIPLEAFREAIVLDAGCGTGEKTMIMATLGPRLVIGIDRALEPLRNAKAWAEHHGIDRAVFVQASVLELGWLRPASVDVIHCTGVLHHTPDPLCGFRELAKVLRPGGDLILYVYNPYGRAYIRLKRALVTLLGGRRLERREYWAKRLFPIPQEPLRDSTAVYYDFYCHPHESYHSLGEVLGWLNRHGLRLAGLYPPVSFRGFCHAWAKSGRPGLVKRLATWIARRVPDQDGEPRRPGPVHRAVVQAAALVYVLARRTHVGWAVVGVKR